MTNIHLTVAMPVGATGGRWELIPDVPTLSPTGVLTVTTAWGLINSGGTLTGKTTGTGAGVTLPTQAGVFGTLRLTFNLVGPATLEGLRVRVELKETSAGVMDIPTLINASRATVVTPPAPAFTPVPAAPIVIIPTPPPPLSSLTNDGDKMLAKWASVDPTGYVNWAVERADGAADQYFQCSPMLPIALTAYFDGTVDDNINAYYKVYGVKADGTRVEVMSYHLTQPARVWETTPIVVSTNNQTISGRYIRVATPHNIPSGYSGTGPYAPAATCITIMPGVTGTVIENNFLVGTGNAVEAKGNNSFTVRGNRGKGLHPGVAGSGQGMWVTAYRPTSVTVEHNSVEGFRMGLYVNGDSTQLCQTLIWRFNRHLNLEGRKALDATTYDDNPDRTVETRYFPIGHALQINSAFRIATCEVSWNEIIQQPGKSFTEDTINFYNSSGTSSSWMLCHHNVIYGTYSASPSTRFNSGCGIIIDGQDQTKLADKTLNGYLRIYSNVVIATSNGGIGIAYGCNTETYSNRCVSSGFTFDGLPVYGTNVGIYIQAMYNTAVNPMENHSLHDNYSTWWQPPGTVQRQSSSTGNNNTYYVNNTLPGYTGSGNLQGPQATVADEKREYLTWKAALAAAGFYTGHAA